MGEQLAADDGDQVAAVAELLVDHQGHVVHQGVEVGVVAGRADLDLSGHLGALGQHLLRRLLAGDLQPALVHVLEQRVGYAVSGGGGAGPVPADHDAVQRDLLLHRGGIALREVRELGPGVDAGVLQRHVAVGFEQLVALAVQAQHVASDAVGVAGVGTAGHRAAGTQHHFLALDLADRDHVDPGQEGRAVGDLVVQRLRVGRRDVEFFAHRFHAIGGGDRNGEGAEFQAGCLAQAHISTRPLGCRRPRQWCWARLCPCPGSARC